MAWGKKIFFVSVWHVFVSRFNVRSFWLMRFLWQLGS